MRRNQDFLINCTFAHIFVEMIIVPKNLPLIAKLQPEGLGLTDTYSGDEVPLKVLFLNLMPDKEDSEADIYRSLVKVTVPLQITLVKMSNMRYKTTPQEYMDTFYEDVAEIMERGEMYDAMIINGAPFERFEYEEIVYWKQLCVFFRWADKHVKSTLHICWSAFARIYYNWGIHFKRNSFQWSGAYPHTIIDKTSPLVDGTLREIVLPVSRPWYLSHDEMQQVSEAKIIAESPVTGPGLIVAYGGKQVYAVSHPEYGPERIKAEYFRDMQAGKNPMFPFNYFEADDATKPVKYSWKPHRDRLFANWISEYVLK